MYTDVLFASTRIPQNSATQIGYYYPASFVLIGSTVITRGQAFKLSSDDPDFSQSEAGFVVILVDVSFYNLAN